MKKILAICLVLVLGLALVGCNNNNDVIDDEVNNPPIENNGGNEDVGGNEDLPEDPIANANPVTDIMTELMTKAEIQVNAPMQDVIPAEMAETYIGLTQEDFEAYVADSVFYESMISPANQSFCLIRVNDLTKIDELKQKIFDNCNPRKWICMTAERVVVVNSGEYILLAMASDASCSKLIPAFEEHFDHNVGTVMDKTVAESTENFEDLPGGGSMAL